MKVSIKFFWRDFWAGFYLSDEEPKLVICIIPCFPIIIEWEGRTMNKDELPHFKDFADWATRTNATPIEDIRALTELARAKGFKFGDEVNWQFLNHVLICAHVRVPPLELMTWSVEKAGEAQRWAEKFYVNRFIREIDVPEMPEFLRPYYDENIFPEQKREGHWEAVADEDDDTFWRVRWSEKDSQGRYLYVRHYGGDNGKGWNQNAAERNAKEFNEKGRGPWEWPYWKGAK